MEKKSFLEVVKEPQNIITLGVIIISMCALVVSIMQTRIMSEQRELMYQRSKAEVWPRLLAGYTKSDGEGNTVTELYFSLGNAGVGPAIITDVRVSYKEKAVIDWWDLFKKFDMPKEIRTTIGNSAIHNSIISNGDGRIFLNLNNNLPLAQEFFKRLKDVKMEIWYNSIYDDKWKLTFQNRESVTEEADPSFSLPDKEQFKN